MTADVIDRTSSTQLVGRPALRIWPASCPLAKTAEEPEAKLAAKSRSRDQDNDRQRSAEGLTPRSQTGDQPAVRAAAAPHGTCVRAAGGMMTVQPGFELAKRDGHHEEYDIAKLARSLACAGVPSYMLAGILDAVDPRPGMDTNSLRERIERELALRQPLAAVRYTTTRTLTARGSRQAGYGWACINPEDLTRLSLRPGDTTWLSHEGTKAPFSVQCLEDVGRGHVWLNRREMAAMGVADGARLRAAGGHGERVLPPVCPSQVRGSTCATRPRPKARRSPAAARTTRVSSADGTADSPRDDRVRSGVDIDNSGVPPRPPFPSSPAKRSDSRPAAIRQEQGV
ncbi:hypothetical protein JXD38_08015 [candidate division WOR-3 bacterium]|nr:hypothetical protein [candidate division WOR-3 bacterium]